jgi:Uma2 family endonuclease
MSAIPQRRMNAEQFLAWACGSEGRFELVDGEVLAQAAERAIHAKIKGAAFIALMGAVKKAGLPCHVLPDGMAVRVSEASVFEPDAQIYCGPELPPGATVVKNPIVVVEVLSPSTARNDALGKLEGYFRLASIAHYLIIDPERPLVIHHARGEGETILTRIIREGSVTLDPPGLSFKLAEIYQG